MSSEDNLGRPITGQPIDPEAGYEMMPGPTARLLDPIPVPYGRNAQTDARTMAEVEQERRQRIIEDDSATSTTWATCSTWT